MQGIRLNFPTCPMVVLKGKHTIILTGKRLGWTLLSGLWLYVRLRVKDWWLFAVDKREQSRGSPASL